MDAHAQTFVRKYRRILSMLCLQILTVVHSPYRPFSFSCMLLYIFRQNLFVFITNVVNL